MDAISTHRPYGVGYLVGWCRSAGTFDDPFHGSRFRADGRYLMGPASTDLPTYPFERVSGDVVIVGSATTPTRRTVGGAASVPTVVCPAARLIEPTFADAEWTSPADAVTVGDGWTTVTAELRVSPGGAELCAGTRCVDVAVESRIAGGSFSSTGRWLVRVEDGVIVDVVAVPRT